MAAVAHLGVGLAAKRIAPRVPLWVLLVATWTIDLVWGIFFLAGLERFPGANVTAPAPFSHGLLMALVWSALAGLLAWAVARDGRTGTIVGLVVFSHWLVDLISKPMLAAFPTDAGLPLLFGGSPTVGLGMYRTLVGQTLGEYGTLIIGAVVYVATLTRLRREKKAAETLLATSGSVTT